MSKVKEWILRRALTRFLKGEQMENILKFFSGRKTYVAAAVTLVGCLGGLVGVPVPGFEGLDKGALIQTAITAILGIFLRQGITKSGPTP